MSRAAVTFQVGSAAADSFADPLDVVVDDELPEWDFKALYSRPYQSTVREIIDVSLAGQPRGRLPLRHLFSHGCKPFRVYGAKTEPTITTLNPIFWPIYQAADYVYPGTVIIFANEDARGYDGTNQVVSMGLREELFVEVVQFNGDTRAETKYGRIDGADVVSVEQATNFIDEAGVAAAEPTYTTDGVFTSPVPVYGAFLTRYRVPYRSYRVYYDVESPAWNVSLNSNGNVYDYDDLEDAPPLIVVINVDGKIRILSISRSYRPYFPVSNWNFSLRKDADYNEEPEKRGVVVRDVDGVEVEQITKVTLIEGDGIRLSLNIADLGA